MGGVGTPDEREVQQRFAETYYDAIHLGVDPERCMRIAKGMVVDWLEHDEGDRHGAR